MSPALRQAAAVEGRATERRPRYALILSLGLAARLLTICFTLVRFPADWLYTSRGVEQGLLGQSLLLGQGLSSPFGGHTGPTAFLAPGYPVLVAAVFRIFGSYTLLSAVFVMVIHALLNVATIWLMMRVAGEMFDSATAEIAGGIWALSPPLIWLPTIFWDTSLSALALMLLLALALRCRDGATLPLWIAMGSLCGLELLVNPSLLIVFVALLGWAAWQTLAQRRSLLMPCVGFAMMALLLSPWALRNARVFHAFIPLRSNMGYELWQGNRPGADGFFHTGLHPSFDRRQMARYVELGEVRYMCEKKELAMASIRANPMRFLELTAKRIMCFWSGYEGERTALLIVMYVTATSVAGFAGLFLLRRRRALASLFLLPLLVFPLPYYITHPDFRFRVLIDPLLTILSAYVIVRATSWLRSRRQAADPSTL